MTAPARLPDKALIYATCDRGLLIFQEPEFPEVPPQVPGGTIEAGEDPLSAARREFTEETGLSGAFPMSFLICDDHEFDRDGHPHQVRRFYVHIRLAEDVADTWDHFETEAHDGAPPILFRFSWVPLAQAAERLGLGMGAALPQLRAHLDGGKT